MKITKAIIPGTSKDEVRELMIKVNDPYNRIRFEVDRVGIVTIYIPDGLAEDEQDQLLGLVLNALDPILEPLPNDVREREVSIRGIRCPSIAIDAAAVRFPEVDYKRVSKEADEVLVLKGHPLEIRGFVAELGYNSGLVG